MPDEPSTPSPGGTPGAPGGASRRRRRRRGRGGGRGPRPAEAGPGAIPPVPFTAEAGSPDDLSRPAARVSASEFSEKGAASPVQSLGSLYARLHMAEREAVIRKLAEYGITIYGDLADEVIGAIDEAIATAGKSGAWSEGSAESSRPPEAPAPVREEPEMEPLAENPDLAASPGEETSPVPQKTGGRSRRPRRRRKPAAAPDQNAGKGSLPPKFAPSGPVAENA